MNASMRLNNIFVLNSINKANVCMYLPKSGSAIELFQCFVFTILK